MKLRSYSKINLSLRVLKKMSSGLHDIQSNSILIDLHDQIKINRSYKNKNEIFFKGDFARFVNKKDNSIKSIVKYLEKEKIFKSNYKFTITKNIPVFSGLGGGTSNAVTIFRHFQKKKINSKIINELAKTIGSDFKLFLQKQSFQSSLAKVTNYKKSHIINMIVVFPYKLCSTKKIYSNVNSFSKPCKNKYGNILNTKKFIKLISKEKNDLQPIVEKKYPIIKKIMRFLKNQKNCVFSRMTGSGSACFGVFLTKKNAHEALLKVRKKFPVFFSVITKTI